ncbi:MAG TPA: hypothetical protein V6D07_09615 [Trichocoleus sp.]
MRQQRQINQWIGSGIVALCLLLHPTASLAQALRPEVRDPFLADPLLDRPRDPLLPMPSIPRPLSPLEEAQLEADLNALNAQAANLFQLGQADEAFDLWIREVRLRRLLGTSQELTAIQRVGQQAWTSGRTQEVQLLTARLRVVRDQIKAAQPLNQELLQETATGFEILGAPEDAIAIYQQLSELALAEGESLRHLLYLESVGQLQRQWFKFADAATTYRQLALLVQDQQGQAATMLYLQQAIRNYEQARQFEPAISTQQELMALYEAQALRDPVPGLQRAMARNYEVLNNSDAASRYYQASYTNAITLEQFDVASQVIEELARLYRSLNRLEDVLYLYQQRLLVERKSYDGYGAMDSFDQLGQTYEQLGQPDQAVNAFREGLVLATHLQHRQDYFREQIQRLAPPPQEEITIPGNAVPNQPLPATLPLEEKPAASNEWQQ